MNIQTQPQTSTELVAVNALVPAEVFAPGGVEAIIKGVVDKVRAIETDISTPAGRKAIGSLAYKIARSKTALDEMGKTLVSQIKAQANLIDADRRTIRERLDELQDEVRKPLTDWENAEKDRVESHEAALTAIVEWADYGDLETADSLRKRLDFLLNYPPRAWQEFAARAEKTLKAEIDQARERLAAAEKREAEAAEAERLRREQAEREQRERDERIAREAAERARVEAEQLAREEAAQVAAAAEEERQAAEQERQRTEQEAAAAREAQAKAEARAEEARIDGHKRSLASVRGMIADACSPFNSSSLIRHITKILDGMSEIGRDFEEYQEQADTLISNGRQRIAEQLAKVEVIEEELRQKIEKDRQAEAERQREAVIETERQRVAAEHEAAAAEAAKREANRRHRAKINNAARDALVAAGLTIEHATFAVAAIATGSVPNVKISY